MLKQDAVGWSHKFIKKKCASCGIDNKIMFVQLQKRIRIGPIKLINLGQRTLGRECKNCLDITAPSRGDMKLASTLEYYFKKQIKSTLSVGHNDKTSNRKYPILDKKTRKLIRSNNRKEGLISGSIGIVIAIVLSAWFSWWLWIVALSWFGGLYAILEDPELKHRAHIEKTGKVYDGLKSPEIKRSLR